MTYFDIQKINSFLSTFPSFLHKRSLNPNNFQNILKNDNLQNDNTTTYNLQPTTSLLTYLHLLNGNCRQGFLSRPTKRPTKRQPTTSLLTYLHLLNGNCRQGFLFPHKKKITKKKQIECLLLHTSRDEACLARLPG